MNQSDYSASRLNRMLESALYDLKMINTGMLATPAPRGKYRQKMEDTFQIRLRTLKSIIRVGRETKFRLAKSYRDIDNIVQYYQERKNILFSQRSLKSNPTMRTDASSGPKW